MASQKIYKLGWKIGPGGRREPQGCYSWIATSPDWHTRGIDYCQWYSGMREVEAEKVAGIQSLLFAFETKEAARTFQSDPAYIALFEADAQQTYPAPACYLAPRYACYWHISWGFYWMQLASPLSEQAYREHLAEYIRELKQLDQTEKAELIMNIYPVPAGSICCKSVRDIYFIDGMKQEILM